MKEYLYAVFEYVSYIRVTFAGWVSYPTWGSPPALFHHLPMSTSACACVRASLRACACV